MSSGHRAADVRRLVADCLGVDAHALHADVELGADLGVDSLDLADLALALEERLSIVVADEVLATVRTFGELVAVSGRREVVVGRSRGGHRWWQRLGLAALRGS